MSENDYIAEYIKEKYPKLLGMNYAVWKMGRVLGNALRKVVNELKTIDWEQASEYIEKHKEDIDG